MQLKTTHWILIAVIGMSLLLSLPQLLFLAVVNTEGGEGFVRSLIRRTPQTAQPADVRIFLPVVMHGPSSPSATPAPQSASVLEVKPSSAKIKAGKSASFQVTADPSLLGDAPKSWTVDGLPPNSDAVFTGGERPYTRNLVIETSSKTPPGTYTAIVSAQLSGNARSQAGLIVEITK